jgi:hypothetical protein
MGKEGAERWVVESLFCPWVAPVLRLTKMGIAFVSPDAVEKFRTRVY